MPHAISAGRTAGSCHPPRWSELFHILPGRARWRQILSTDATRPGAGPEVCITAFAALDPHGAERPDEAQSAQGHAVAAHVKKTRQPEPMKFMPSRLCGNVRGRDQHGDVAAHDAADRKALAHAHTAAARVFPLAVAASTGFSAPKRRCQPRARPLTAPLTGGASVSPDGLCVDEDADSNGRPRPG